MFKELWKDPVWSSVIAGVILSVISYVFLRLRKAQIRVKGLKRKKSKLLIYVSAGGTCRDPMAKAITQKLFDNLKLNFELDIKSAALISPSSPKVSYAARHVTKKLLEEDILARDKTRMLTNELVEAADLILVMSRELLSQFQKKFNIRSGKVYVFKEFFGLQGDIQDPFPDGRDSNTFERYKSCAIEMRSILENNTEALIKALSV